MNTRQKLTLGVAAIFMVTLTIVGVTYAYFVTRVTGALTESVNIQTAKVGAIVYRPGNGTDDSITLSNILPGTVMYKTFSVENEDADAAGDYKLYLTSTPDHTSYPVFVHTATALTGSDTSDADCYPHTTGTPVTAASLVNSMGENISTDATGGTPSSCFGGTAYNNVYVTLYAFDTNAVVVNADGTTITTGESNLEGSTNVFNSETRVKAITGINSNTAKQFLNNTTAGTTDDGNATNTLAGGAIKYYVLKVEYKNNNSNQNIENDAKLTLKVNIE